MTQAQTLSAIRALGLTARAVDGEYRATFKGVSPERAEALAHYTDCRDDAWDTAQVMAKQGIAAQ